MAKEYVFYWLATLSTMFTIVYTAQNSNGDVSSYSEYGQAAKKLPYFDLTDMINQGDWEQVEKAMNQTSRVYYSTDLLITDILQLSEMVVQLNKLAPFNDTIKPSPCLMVAFQMTVNRSDIDWRHIEDVLYLSTTTDNSDEYKERLKVMKQHLCGVVLDFQLGGLGQEKDTNYRDPFRYSHEWDLSFTKYAKKNLKSIFGNDIKIPVGVTINKRQVQAAESSEILFQQEINFADFLMVNLDFSAFTLMPLDFSTFHDEFRVTRDETERLLNKYTATTDSGYDLGNASRSFLFNSTRDIPIKNITYMASWVEQSPSEYNYDILWAWAYNNALNSSQTIYLSLFQEYISALLHVPYKKLEVIPGAYLTSDKIQSQDGYHSLGRRTGLIPYLYTHVVDATSCELGSSLLRISHLDAVVVNEFTWNALAHNEEKLQHIQSQDCAKVEKLETPKRALLFATRGIGQHWNTTQQKFESLVREHASVVGMNLTTIVFSADDAKKSAVNADDPYEYITPGYQNPVRIAKFMKRWLEGNETEVGCLLDVMDVGHQIPLYLVYNVRHKCHWVSGSSVPSVLVIQYKMNLTSVNMRFENPKVRESKEKLHKVLLDLLVARERLNKWCPEIKQIILNVEFNRNDVVIQSGNRMIRPYEIMLRNWAYIHGIQVMRPLNTRGNQLPTNH